MTLITNASFLRNSLTRSAVISAAALILALWSAAPVAALPGSVPSVIENLRTGEQIEEVTRLLQGEAGVTNDAPGTPNNNSKRGPRLTWAITSPYYDKVIFEFTEKGRLFIIRFTLKPAAREKFGALKNDFFTKYELSTEDPNRMRPGGDLDMMMYAPINGKALFFVEFTNTKTGQKHYELFNRLVSSEDRAVPLPMPDFEKLKAGASPNMEQSPEATPSQPPAAEQSAQPVSESSAEGK